MLYIYIIKFIYFFMEIAVQHYKDISVHAIFQLLGSVLDLRLKGREFKT